MKGRLRKSFVAAAFFATAILTACGSPSSTSVTVSVGKQCEPVNQYDTRCEVQASRAAAPPSRGPITLTRSAHITYEINPGPSGQKANLISWLEGPNPYTDIKKKGLRPGTASDAWELPLKIEVDAPAGTKPWVRWGYVRDATCRVLINGQDVTLNAKPLVATGGLYECYAGRQP